MEEVLRELGGLLLKAVPTLILVALLHSYLKGVFFRPMQRVLEARHEATEGARRLAEESLAKASEKAAQYEAALRAARNDIFREQEEFRQRLRQEHARTVQEARTQAGAMVKEGQQQLAAELASAKDTLRQHTDSLAEEIVESILRRRPV